MCSKVGAPSHASHMITNLKMSSYHPVWLQFLSKSPSGCETATVTPFRDNISQPCLYPSVLPHGFYSSLIMKDEHVLLTSAKLCSVPQSILLSKAFVRRKHWTTIGLKHHTHEVNTLLASMKPIITHSCAHKVCAKRAHSCGM